MSESQSRGERPLTYYDVLDLDRDATPGEIKDAYYRLARESHPDVASEDPEQARRFALVNEAYRTLSDPQRRHQYDRTLPQKSYPLRHPTPEKIWREATDVVLIRSDRFGPLNQAMQSVVPIALDDDLLVITVPGGERHLAGHMETASNRNAIRNALELVAGRRLDFRTIDGATVEDWNALKGAESRARAPAGRPKEAPSTEREPAARGGQGPWDELIRRIHREYQQLPKRQYPQTKAQYLRRAIGWIVQTEEEVRYGDGWEEESHDRLLARAIERLGGVMDLPPVVVALEYERTKRSGEL